MRENKSMKKIEDILEEMGFCVFRRTSYSLEASDFEGISLIIIETQGDLYAIKYVYMNENNETSKVGIHNYEEIKDIIKTKLKVYRR